MKVHIDLHKQIVGVFVNAATKYYTHSHALGCFAKLEWWAIRHGLCNVNGQDQT